jgi:hypothetical protein
MAKTIPQLTDATTVNAADELIVQQGGITKRATGAELAKGLNTINGTVNVRDFGAVADCTGQGIGTDVVPALLAAVNHAVSTIGDGARVVLPQGRYRAASTCTLDLQAKTGISLKFEGIITPDATAATFITIQNGEAASLSASIFEGGIFNGWLAAQPFGPCDYSTTRDAPAAGGQEMFLIRGVRNYTVDLHAHSYAGRLLRTADRANSAHPHTQAIKGNIVTERSVLDLSKPRVAQCLWADYGSVANPGNWGSLERLVCDFDYYGPVWKGLNDIELTVVDAAFGKTGLGFYGCSVITGSTWYVGDVDQPGSKNHVEFGKHNGIGCSFVNVNSMLFLNAGNGLVADTLFSGSFSIFYKAVQSLPFTTVASLTDCGRIYANVGAFGYGASMLSISGSSTQNINVSVDSSSAVLTSSSVTISSNVSGDVLLSPKANNSASGVSSVVIEGTGIVLINDPVMSGDSGSFHFDITNSANSVYLAGGKLSGAASAYKTERPRSVTSAIGVDAHTAFALRSNQGGNSAGEGGSLSFGISAAGFFHHAPIARVSGSLANSTGTELQGGLKLSVRPSGGAGQTLQDGLVVDSTTVDGETYATLLSRLSGSNVAKRIKVGGTNTGPSGSGRALYVDN